MSQKTTHWKSCELLARMYPAVTVDPEPIFIRDGSVYTSAGVCAGMDLALSLVEQDHGRDLALAVARRLVLFLQRPGGQSQFSAQLAGQLSERAPLRDLQAFVLENPQADLSVESLAERAAMSPRNFARVFARDVGTTPARWVERARIEAARRIDRETISADVREGGQRDALLLAASANANHGLRRTNGEIKVLPRLLGRNVPG